MGSGFRFGVRVRVRVKICGNSATAWLAACSAAHAVRAGSMSCAAALNVRPRGLRNTAAARTRSPWAVRAGVGIGVGILGQG